MRIKVILVCLSAATISLDALAQSDDSSKSASPLASIYQCAELENDTARLACFDSKVSVLRTKEEKKEIVAIDAKAAKKIKREAFGFSLPSLPKLGLPSLGGDKDGPDVLTYEVKSVRKLGRDYVFYMKNGQVWRQVSGRFNYIPKGDLSATINSGAMGSFRLSLSNGKERVRGMGVRRIE